MALQRSDWHHPTTPITGLELAHLGKYYRLHLRRDLCLGCLNNARGIGETQLCSFFISRSNPARPNINIQGEKASPFGDKLQFAITWRTGLIASGGTQFLVQLKLSNVDNLTQHVTVRMEFYNNGILRGWIPCANQPTGDCQSFNSGTSLIAMRDTDHTFWGSSTVLANGGFRAAFWSEE
jgi:hypothetical protein